MTTRQPRLGHVVLGGLLVVIGVLWLIDAVTSLDVPWDILLPVALVVVGAGLVYGASTGTHGGLITFGVILTIIVVLSSGLEVVLDLPFEGGIGERRHAPTGIAQTEYRLAIGDMTVDLSNATPPREPIEISVVMGELTVIVPEGIGIWVDARAGVGEVIVFDRSQSGVGPELIEDPFGHSDVLPAIRLVVRVGIGKVEVRRP